MILNFFPLITVRVSFIIDRGIIKNVDLTQKLLNGKGEGLKQTPKQDQISRTHVPITTCPSSVYYGNVHTELNYLSCASPQKAAMSTPFVIT